MAATSTNRRQEIVQQLTHAVDSFLEAVGSGRVGFDQAVQEYVAATEGELASAFEHYVQAVVAATEAARASGQDASQYRQDARRETLRDIAARLDVPEVTAFIQALIASLDKNISLPQTLERQSQQLHR
jgi:DICT domain-containing protein